MTDKQIRAAEEELNKKYYGNESHISENLKQPWTKKDERLEEELSCRRMINSLLIYGWSTEKGGYAYNTYLKSYIEGGLITERRLAELIAEQKKDFENAVVTHDAYTDSEGCSYNGCRWADEM
jgi:hypothetical protein